jgi:hypothetical protein
LGIDFIVNFVILVIAFTFSRLGGNAGELDFAVVNYFEPCAGLPDGSFSNQNPNFG